MHRGRGKRVRKPQLSARGTREIASRVGFFVSPENKMGRVCLKGGLKEGCLQRVRKINRVQDLKNMVFDSIEKGSRVKQKKIYKS